MARFLSLQGCTINWIQFCHCWAFVVNLLLNISYVLFDLQIANVKETLLNCTFLCLLFIFMNPIAQCNQ